jgi:hypothetical protein
MKKSETKNLVDSMIKDFIDTCPHCDARAHFQMLFNDSHSNSNGDVTYYITFRCVPCKKLMLKTLEFKQNRYANDEKLEFVGWQEKFPNDDIVYVSKFEETVPADVLGDFKEGVISLNSKCYKGSVSMFRRSLQSALLNLGANADDDLINQIKNMGSLTQDIKDWAHNIRIFGNWGAHPQNDNLKEVDQKVADEVRMFIEEFFNYVYVMPGRVAKARITSKPKVEAVKGSDNKGDTQ